VAFDRWQLLGHPKCLRVWNDRHKQEAVPIKIKEPRNFDRISVRRVRLRSLHCGCLHALFTAIGYARSILLEVHTQAMAQKVSSTKAMRPRKSPSRRGDWNLGRPSRRGVTMSSESTSGAIDALLYAEIVARIGYIDRRGLPCIVPISYAYDGRALYGYSLLGAKIENMGANPSVCVEVDRVRNAADWCSVIVRGTFDELHGADAIMALERLTARLSAVALEAGAPKTAAQTFVDRKGGVGIVYRIEITEKHGRWSKPSSAVDTEGL
jgi:nitroimidazol reductase NimA-like FMN-containing flavoprotein (pyridoxamine 5'-phosphate oxidase superfamily)